MKLIYKIRHKSTGKFVRIKLTSEGIKVWKEKNVIEGNPGWGKVLFDTHKGWTTPPKPSNEEFAQIGCEIAVFNLKIEEL